VRIALYFIDFSVKGIEPPSNPRFYQDAFGHTPIGPVNTGHQLALELRKFPAQLLCERRFRRPLRLCAKKALSARED
jgi:hypothetical protein